MSVMYATAAELASFLQKDLDTSSATLAIQIASQLFSTRACTMFAPTSITYQVIGQGYWQLRLPFDPIISVSAVRIVGQVSTVTITDYSRIKTVLYRLAGFGVPGMYPPDMVEVDLIHGYATAPDDVKGVVLETAAAAYSSPDTTVVQEMIDDYSIKSSATAGGMQLSPSAQMLADLYRGTIAA
jgi:hypothetical protein